ncbi:MAG: single-stranded-DNA-specific exonuclease RecJ [Candidatus Babeliales bacterium]|jgi:single-stranded-DNA-specific exonuclease
MLQSSSFAHQPPPLDVTSSTISGLKYRWITKNVAPEAVRALAYKHGLSLPIAHVLASRGITDDEQVRSYLFSSYEQDVPHPRSFKGIEQAVTRIIRAITSKEKILIFGDYDVDGITSTAMLMAALIPLGATINFFLPHREKDGYGLSARAVHQAAKNGYSLIITVDNGITAFEAATAAQKHGIDLIITDHHQPRETLPPATAIINPQQKDCAYPFKYLAGVGVTFKLVNLLYETLGIAQLPDKTYELLMLGTIADVVPLIGENRFWVRYGLHRINQQFSSAMQKLVTNGSLNKSALDSLDIGFIIAPQINALGRLADPRDAVKFLISADNADVERIGDILKTMNEERKNVERKIYGELETAIQTQRINLEHEYVIMATNDSWPSGVIGLVAGKLMHNYGRPTFLFHTDHKEGTAKGSCRSIPEINIFELLSTHKDLLIHFGGHAHAAGLKLKLEHLPELKERLTSTIAARYTLADLQPKLTIDAELQLPEATQQCCDNLEQLEPFGNRNPQPLFMVRDVTLIRQPQLLKDRHVKCMVFAHGVIKPVIFFNRPELIGPLQQCLDKPFHLAGHILKNEWGGTTRIELQGIDIAMI